MIPKILHQVWLGTAPVPEKFINFVDGWKKLHPDWDYILWNESNLNDTNCWELIESCDKYSSKSNVARLYAILNFGGVYADFDIEWKNNIDDLLVHKAFAAKESIESPYWLNYSLPYLYCNAIFGAEKNNPWIKYQFENLKDYVGLHPPWGPTLMTKSQILFPENVFTVDQHLFYPYIWNQRHKRNEDFKDSYVVHHWNVSWQKS